MNEIWKRGKKTKPQTLRSKTSLAQYLSWPLGTCLKLNFSYYYYYYYHHFLYMLNPNLLISDIFWLSSLFRTLKVSSPVFLVMRLQGMQLDITCQIFWFLLYIYIFHYLSGIMKPMQDSRECWWRCDGSSAWRPCNSLLPSRMSRMQVLQIRENKSLWQSPCCHWSGSDDVRSSESFLRKWKTYISLHGHVNI